MKPTLSLVPWVGYGLASLVLALGLTWGLYAQTDYGYRFWYDQLEIGAHIDQYGPINRHHRRDFERLDATTHQALFHRIRVAVHDGGQGLEALSYQDRAGRRIPLLRHAEVVHLRDVAHLIDRGRVLVWAAALLWLPLAWLALRRRPPGARTWALVAVTPVLAVIGWLLVAGPTAVFYQFHIWLFPADHEWFFYWQDSLMSTLMKAPALFGGIAVVLVGGTLVLTPLLYGGGLWLARRVRERHQ